MNLIRLSKDYEYVKNVSMKALNNYSYRCHEMAYLTNIGMKEKGYDCHIEDGIYQKRVKHSWVMVPGSLGRFNGGILHFIFHPPASMFGNDLHYWRVITGK